MGKIATVIYDGGMKVRCSVPDKLAIKDGDSCIVDSGGALEYGVVARIEDGVMPSPSKAEQALPHVLRRATLQDRSKVMEAAVQSRIAMETCARKIAARKLDMQVVNVRYSFDMKVVTIMYVSEEKKQFKDLVRELATALRARIDMKQIGVRDAAGITGGIGSCGRLLCCSSWLHTFEAVSVRMAKTQRLSLNPNAISGICGRLKCCLRFENDCYAELSAGLPRDGATVSCRDGCGCVVDRNILARRVKVRFNDGRIGDYGVAEVSQQKKVERSGKGGGENEEKRN